MLKKRNKEYFWCTVLSVLYPPLYGTVHPRRSIRVNLLSVTEEHVDRSRPVGKDGRGASNFISSNFLYKAITLMKFREMFMGLNEGPQSVY